MKEYQSVDAPTADIGLYNNSLMQAQAAAPVSVLAQIESNDSKVTSHVLETVIDELRKLSTNTPGSQALLNEMRKQNETNPKIVIYLLLLYDGLCEVSFFFSLFASPSIFLIVRSLGLWGAVYNLASTPERWFSKGGGICKAPHQGLQR